MLRGLNAGRMKGYGIGYSRR